jgi:hypothetical protein
MGTVPRVPRTQIYWIPRIALAGKAHLAYECATAPSDAGAAQCFAWKIGFASCARRFSPPRRTRKSNHYSSSFGRHCACTSKACVDALVPIHSLWNGASEARFHRSITGPTKTRRSRPTQRTRAPKLPASLTSQVFQRVVLATLSSWDAVRRRPPTPEVAPGLWLQTCPGLAQQRLARRFPSNVLWLCLAKGVTSKVGARFPIFSRSIETRSKTAR